MIKNPLWRLIACAVPMGISIDELNKVLDTQHKTGLVYMMMETNVYCREYLYAKELYKSGVLGQIQFMRGAHYQDYEGLNPAFMGLPPMYYMTHAISPLLDILNTRATKVHCLGSGTMRGELHRQYQNPWPVETAVFRLERTDLSMEITRSLFHVGRGYTEMFNVYGEAGVEWSQIEEERKPVLFEMDPLQSGRRGRPCRYRRIDVPDYAHLLPEPTPLKRI